MGLVSLIPLHGLVYKTICKKEEENCLQGWIKFQCEICNFLFNTEAHDNFSISDCVGF